MNRRDLLIGASASLTAALAGPAISAEPLKVAQVIREDEFREGLMSL